LFSAAWQSPAQVALLTLREAARVQRVFQNRGDYTFDILAAQRADRKSPRQRPEADALGPEVKEKSARKAREEVERLPTHIPKNG
jgi:hypothetical protein